MSANWEVSKSQRICAVTGKVFEEGDEYYSALKESDDSFVRLDYSLNAWDDVNKDELFSFWRTKAQSPDSKKNKRLVIDVEAFYTFFISLENETTVARQVFRYLVALILVRKRILRLDEIEKSPDGEALIIFDTRIKEEKHIPVPEATEEELASAQEELNQIFECNTEI